MFKKVCVFDAFNTIVHITNKKNPYKKLSQMLELNSTEEAELFKIALTESISIEQLAMDFGVNLSDDQINEINQDILDEVNSIEFFEDTVDILNKCIKNKKLVIIASNLAEPYTEALTNKLKSIAPVGHLGSKCPIQLAYSCEMGLMKPDPNFYYEIEGSLFSNDLVDDDVLFSMIGDNEEKDYKIPMECNWDAELINRSQDEKLNKAHWLR